MKPLFLSAFAIAWFCSLACGAGVPSPREYFGFAIGDDYHLANYTQTEAYFRKIAASSERARLVDIGRTEEGRTQWMMIFSAPKNLARLARYKEIAQKLARAEELNEAQARSLATEGRAVVWIDGGLHANETVATHQLIETVWQLASATDPEMRRILDEVIVLCVHANPDGQELVSNWYMREGVAEKRVLTPTPRLYQKYVGHDNNRDFYMSAMKETENINRQLYLEWFPQIVYNHHQPAPVGTTIFVPPFRDPFNYVYDPLVIAGVQALGTAIQMRFLEEGKPGATSRSGANYSTWFNGGLRTTAYFHNMIGLLTEIAGNPTPMQIPFVPQRQLPSSDLTAPVPPQLWRFRQSIDYSLSANRAVLDYAARHREALLFNIYRMGRNAIERGQRDHWTPRPSRIAEITRLAASERVPNETDESADMPQTSASRVPRLPVKYFEMLRKLEWRDPRAFIVPADQPDFPTAVKFINALLKNGVAVHRATREFAAGGRRYPAGSYVVKTDQAFRPHVLDMFEPQDHPNDFAYEGGPPVKPYDVAGWTLAFQMGVRFDRVLERLDGPFERLPYGRLQTPPAGKVEISSAAAAGRGPSEPAGFILDPRVNNTFIVINRLLARGVDVFRLSAPLAGRAELGSGAIYVPARGDAGAIIEQSCRQLGVSARPGPAPHGPALKLTRPRIALWDRYGGSMPSGWTRWLLERFEFPFEVIYAPRIDAGKLRERYDVIVFVSGAIPAPGARLPAVTPPANLPAEYENWVGRLTAEKSIPALKQFLHDGGSIVAIGSSTNLAQHLGLPLKNAFTEPTAAGGERPLPEEKFYVPGSVLAAKVDPTHPLGWGMAPRADFYFDRSPAFRLPAKAGEQKFVPVVWFDSEAPLRSGWAWGQKYLKDSVSVVVAPVGRGTLYLMGSEVAFRGQTHGTFKLLFNALHLSSARANDGVVDAKK